MVESLSSTSIIRHGLQIITPFFVVRYLPQALSCLFYQYLVYIRPFLDFLYSQLGLAALRSTEFLFRDPGQKKKHLSSIQATVILRRLTSHFPTPITLSLYRQAALAIAKRFIRELVQAINFYEPSQASDATNVLALGAGHHPRILLTAYAIDSAYPTRLQPELLELYRRLSTLWQEWNEQYYRDHCHLWGELKPPGNHAQTPAPTPASSTGKGPLKRGCETEQPHLHSSPQVKRPCPGNAPLIAGFRYDPRSKVLICLACESALQTTEAAWYHLRTAHKIIGVASKALIQQFAQYELAPVEDINIPAPKGPPIPGLQKLHGYRCDTCPARLTRPTTQPMCMLYTVTCLANTS
jgi:hypothetical protein